MIAPTATVRITSQDTLEGVARKLQEKLDLRPFRFDSDQDPPHSITAMTECLGYELWLRGDAPEFELVVEASMDVLDRAAGDLVDVSEWFSKHVGLVTDLLCVPILS